MTNHQHYQWLDTLWEWRGAPSTVQVTVSGRWLLIVCSSSVKWNSLDLIFTLVSQHLHKHSRAYLIMVLLDTHLSSKTRLAYQPVVFVHSWARWWPPSRCRPHQRRHCSTTLRRVIPTRAWTNLRYEHKLLQASWEGWQTNQIDINDRMMALIMR